MRLRDNRPSRGSGARALASRALASGILLWSLGGVRAADLPYFNVPAGDGGSWPAILQSIGFEPGSTDARLVVARDREQVSDAWTKRVEAGVILIIEGGSELGESFGFRRTPESVRVTTVTDTHNPGLPILWQKSLDVPRFAVPAEAIVFARERWSGAPLEAGFRRGRGAVFWTAVSPGDRGYERFPYVLQALIDLGLETPYRSSGLWAFFDSAYRSRVDLDYFAARWRKAGLAGLHVAAWHFYEPAPDQDAYLAHLIEACHREGILVYAWLDLPHVSDAFWTAHPEWREKTAMLQDAQLDWRKLMNLTNQDCFRAVAEGVKKLMGRFDWDGINLAELYFESLQGMENPARFTPMNDDVRVQFRMAAGFDPLELFRSRNDDRSRRLFLDFRRDLVRRTQTAWIDEVQKMRRTRPDLDLVITQVDDRFDTNMRDAIGADSASLLPMLETRGFTLLVEDPATVWNLGADRYMTIAQRYRMLTHHPEKLAIDINVTERYQDVYPTKQQTGIELSELVHNAALVFRRVALYFENSLLAPDLPLLAAAAPGVVHMEARGATLVVRSSNPIGLNWRSPAMVDGRPWPVSDRETVWLPAGSHTVEPGNWSGPRLVRLNGELLSARATGSTEIAFHYLSDSRAIACFDRKIRKVELDGKPLIPGPDSQSTLLLPRGEHFVTTAFD